jgi:iron complex transport system ATP-binding protein
MLELFDIQAGYGRTRVLGGISAMVSKGEIMGLVGPNGAGKTTLIKCIARIIRPSGGWICIDGTDTLRLSRPALARKIGYVPQHLPSRFSMNVFETVLTGRRPHASWRPSQRDLAKTASIIRQLGLDELTMRDLGELSGGQIQKVLLARALAQEPDYLLLDEPTSSLDLYHQLEVMEIVKALVRKHTMGAVMAMHDLTLAGRFADNLLMMHNGVVFCHGRPAELLTAGTIREVYGVEAAVRMENGHLFVHPLQCAGRL